MVGVADELADSFDGAYKVEGIEAYFELATDLMRFSQCLKRKRLGSLTDAQIYLNVTKDFVELLNPIRSFGFRLCLGSSPILLRLMADATF